MTVLVIGGTGTTGSRVATFLRGRGAALRIASRRPSPASAEFDSVRFDWADPASHRSALQGVRDVYLVAPTGVVDPAPLVEPFLEVAGKCGVRRIVMLSSSAVAEGAPGLGELHSMVRAAFSESTVLRPSWFMQNFLGDHPLAQGIRDRGEIVTATGEGRIAFVDAGDIAAVAGHALLDDISHPAEHVITGPEALSYADAGAALIELTGWPVTHRTVAVGELTERLVGAGYSPEFAAALGALDTAIAGGAEDRVTSTVLDVTGRRPRSFREFVTSRKHRAITAGS